ncbi:hypothetical protein ACVDG5_024665 [Mesorhizobium sp. ORM6]
MAVLDIIGREDGDGASQRLGAIRSHDELLTYVVRDDKGKILLRSHAADLAVFPPYERPGFGRTATHRLYSEEALEGTVRITIAEPLAHRAQVVRRSRWAPACRSFWSSLPRLPPWCWQYGEARGRCAHSGNSSRPGTKGISGQSHPMTYPANLSRWLSP